MKHIFSIVLIFFIGALGCNRTTKPLPNYEVHGIDVSHHQKAIIWDSIANSHINFVFVKASEGITLQDSLFQYNWASIKRIGLHRGAYHFFRPGYSGKEQANNFLNQVDLEPGDLAPVLDVEVMDGVNNVKLLKEMYAWIYHVEIATGIKPIIYTNQKFYNDHIAGYFEDYPLWIARYNTKTPYLVDDRQWNFWQYGNRGRIKGIEGDVDFNVFASDLMELKSLCLPAPLVQYGP